MELTKFSDNYSFEDITDLWKITGSIHKESSNKTRISIFIRTIDNNQYLGNFNYTINPNNTISVNCESPETFNKNLFIYGINLVEQILNNFKNN